MLLNSDTVVFENALDNMVEFMDSHPDVAAISPRMWYDTNKTLEISCQPVYTPYFALFLFTPFGRYTGVYTRFWKTNWKIWHGIKTCNVKALCTACVVISRKALEEVGLFDERIFMYFDDQDLSQRLMRKKLKMCVIPNAEIVHLYRQSAEQNPHIIEQFWKDAYTYYRKYFNIFSLLVLKLGLKLMPWVNKFYVRWERRVIKPTIIEVSKEDLKISWTRQKNATGYLIEIAFDPNFTGTVGRRLQETAISFPKGIKRYPGDTLYWRVAPLNVNNAVGKFKYYIVKIK